MRNDFLKVDYSRLARSEYNDCGSEPAERTRVLNQGSCSPTFVSGLNQSRLLPTSVGERATGPGSMSTNLELSKLPSGGPERRQGESLLDKFALPLGRYPE